MANTLFIGKVYQCFDELSSTNDYAVEMLAKSRPPEGTVVRAASQSAGRGQFGSQWVAAAGKNLTLSIILYPVWLKIDAQFDLSIAVALALHDLVSGHLHQPDNATTAIDVTVKWPNDLYLGDRKTAGTLIQNALSGGQIQSSVVGIGLNVNQLDFGSEAPGATSLALAVGRPFDLNTLADDLFTCLERRYLQLKSGHADTMRVEYVSHLYRFGQTGDYERADGTPLRGTIEGITAAGQLAIQSAERGRELFSVKEVRFC